MQVTLRASIDPAPKRATPGPLPLPLLAHGGAAVILGAPVAIDALAVPIVPADNTLFGPRGACVAADGSLWVADTGHHRLLGWPGLPEFDGAPATMLVGQPTFGTEGRNAHGDPGPATLNVPAGVCACGEGIAVADGWNHRVLLWHTLPRRHNQPADVVLGQESFHDVAANRGSDAPRADTLFWPFGVAWDGERLMVADTGNRRVLVWDGLPSHSGQAADLVLGQTSFSCRDENAGGAAARGSMRWPHGISFLGPRVCIADAGNNRVMVWHEMPTSAGQPCDVILGQRSAAAVDHNLGDYWPSAAALNMPYAVTAIDEWLVVADTASSRLVAWHSDDLTGMGKPARLLACQPDWESKGDNRWQAAARDSVCWPFGLAGDRQFAVIADAGNNRVMLWRWHASVGDR